MKAEQFIKDKLKEFETAEMGGSYYLFKYNELVKILNEFMELKRKKMIEQIQKVLLSKIEDQYNEFDINKEEYSLLEEFVIYIVIPKIEKIIFERDI